MPNPHYREKAISNEGGEKSPNKVGKIDKRSKKFYQQPNRFGMKPGRYGRNRKAVLSAKKQKGNFHVVPVNVN